jgi:hypothetical protein
VAADNLPGAAAGSLSFPIACIMLSGALPCLSPRAGSSRFFPVLLHCLALFTTLSSRTFLPFAKHISHPTVSETRRLPFTCPCHECGFITITLCMQRRGSPRYSRQPSSRQREIIIPPPIRRHSSKKPPAAPSTYRQEPPTNTTALEILGSDSGVRNLPRSSPLRRMTGVARP